ncbi:MAG: SDR family oxidoreductase [Planctomycetota bacterium]|nr:SDR family oxidoreductase [Planctomycetota bacterium]
MTSLQLEGKGIVIIGGTTGLGLSAAEACAEAGASVVVVGRNRDNVDAAVGKIGSVCAGVAGVAGDATHAETALQAIETAVEKFGSFDGLYHVAGGSGRQWGDGPLDQISDEGWQQTIRLNLTSVFCSNRAAVRRFLQQQSGGSVLNMGSVLADCPSPRHFATHAYATAKAAIAGLTKASAAQYAGQNVRFNVIEPALVETPLTERATSDAETMRYIATKQPLDSGRIGQPSDLDAAVVYFLSDQSKFVTGQVFKVDGGWSVTEGQC